MARYTNGPLGPFSGKVGPVVGSYWKGRFLLRAAPDVSQVVPTPARLMQQKKFAMMAKYLNPLKGIINIGFAHDAELRHVTPRNVAMSINMANAFNWNGTAWEIAYDSVQLSRGLFLGVEDMYVGVQGRDMKVSWFSNNAQVAGLTSSGKEILTSPNDKVIVAMCNIERGETLFFYVQRDTETIIQQAPADWQSGQSLQVYVVTVPEIITQYEADPTGMIEEELQLVNEIYSGGLAVSNTQSGNHGL